MKKIGIRLLIIFIGYHLFMSKCGPAPATTTTVTPSPTFAPTTAPSPTVTPTPEAEVSPTPMPSQLSDPAPSSEPSPYPSSSPTPEPYLPSTPTPSSTPTPTPNPLSEACQSINNIGSFSLAAHTGKIDPIGELSSGEQISVTYTLNENQGEVVVRWLDSGQVQIEPEIFRSTISGTTSNVSILDGAAHIRTYTVSGSWTITYTCSK